MEFSIYFNYFHAWTQNETFNLTFPTWWLAIPFVVRFAIRKFKTLKPKLKAK